MNKVEYPLISIITVVFNGEKHIKSTIESVLNQTYSNIEYIIIDGSSNDNTLNIIKSYKNIKLISENDKGIYDAMNKGINLANGEIIGILNCGDYYTENCISNIFDKYKIENLSLKDHYIISGGMYLMNYKKKSKIAFDVNKSLLTKLYQRMTLFHPSIFISKLTYLDYGLFDIKYKIAADYDLLLRFYDKGIAFCFSNKIFTKMDDQGISTSSKGVLISVKECFIIRSKYICFFKNFSQSIYELISYFFSRIYIF
jgi:glycosyltransferase involved in cell wall biosynthesis